MKRAASVFYLLIHGTRSLYWSLGWKYAGENGPVRGMLNRTKPTGGFLYLLTRFGFAWWWWERVCRSVCDAVASLPGGGAAADCIFRKGNEHILWAKHVRRSAFVWEDYCDRGYFYTASMWEGLFFSFSFFSGSNSEPVLSGGCWWITLFFFAMVLNPIYLHLPPPLCKSSCFGIFCGLKGKYSN